MNSRMKIVLTLSLFLLIISNNCFAKSKNEKIKIKSVAVVNSCRVTADCILPNNCDPNLKTEFSNLQLGFIPKPLGQLFLTNKDLKRKIGIFANQIELPDSLLIKREGTILKRATIENKIKAICRAQLGNSKKIEIDFSRIPNHLLLPGKIINWTITANSTNKLGMRLFQLNAKTNGGDYRQLLQAKIVMLVQAAQLIRLARPGEKIDTNMVRSHLIKVKNMRARLPVSYKDVLGKSLSRFKSAGTILRASDIREVSSVRLAFRQRTKTNSGMARASKHSLDRSNWLIRPGEQVNYQIKRGKICLSMPARAIQGGVAGDVISLMNIKNHRRISGTIVAEGRVQNNEN